MSQLKKGALLSYITIFLTNIIGLVLTPFIIKSLGDSEYGLYSLIGSLVAYLSLMDIGLNNATIRFVSKYKSENDIEKERSFLGSIMLVYLALSFVVVIIGFWIYPKLNEIFNKSMSYRQIIDAKKMFILLVFNAAIILPGGMFSAISDAYGKFIIPRIVTLSRYILRSLTVYVILSFNNMAITLVIIDTIFSIIVISVMVYYSVFILRVKFIFRNINFDRVKGIFSYSIWIFILVIARKFQWNISQIVLGINFNTTIVAIFSVGLMLGGYLGAFSGVINNLLLPKAAQSVNDGVSSDDLTKIMIKVGRVNVFLSFLIVSGFALLGREFVILWIGETYIESWKIALIIMFASIINLSIGFGFSILEIKNKIKFRSLSTFIIMSIAVTIGVYLSKSYGLYGILIPIASAMFINSLINNILFVFYFKFNMSKFYKETFLYQSILTLLLTSIFVLLKKYYTINTWSELVVMSTIFTFFYILSNYFFIMTNEEKKYLLKISK